MDSYDQGARLGRRIRFWHGMRHLWWWRLVLTGQLPKPVTASGPAAQIRWGIEYTRRTYGCRD
jgi:hypothetical protein